MHKLPTLYKRTSTGAIQHWTIIVDGGNYFTESGQMGGVTTTSKPTYCPGKNPGKANETTDEEQALKEAQAKWKKKVEKDYSDDPEKVDEAKERNFLPMLAHKYDEHKDSVKFPIVAQPKFDGIRSLHKADGGWSREGKEQCTIPHIMDRLKPFFKLFPEAVLDGELYNHLFKEDFERICSMVKKTKPSVADIFESAEYVRYYIYDCPRIGKLTQKSKWIDRFTEMSTQLRALGIGGPDDCIVIVDHVILNSHDEIGPQHDKWVDEGFEGLMIRYANSPYEQKRTKKLLKVKIFDDNEFPIVDVLPGRGNKADIAARVVCRQPDGGTFKAGIIGSETYAKWLLDNKDEVIGKLGTVKHFRYTKEGVPRFPKLKIVRDYE